MTSLSVLVLPSRLTLLALLGSLLLSMQNSVHASMHGNAQRIERSTSAEAPRIAVDEDGNTIAVWTQYDSAARYGVWTNRYTAQRGWGTPQPLNTNPGQASDVQLAINAHGDAVAVWMQYSDTVAGKVNIWANRFSVQSGWQQAQQIQDDNTNAYFPKVAIDQAGNAIVVWSQNDGAHDRTHIYANRFEVSEGWGAGMLIQSDNTTLASEPEIAMDAVGNASVVWTQFDAAAGGIWTNRYTAGAGWAVAQSITSDSRARTPAIAVDNQNGALAAWLLPDSATYQSNVYASRYTGRWDAPVRVQRNTAATGRAVQLAIDGAGNGIALWQEQQLDATSGAIIATVHASNYAPRSAWEAAQNIGASAEYASPALAMDNRGNAIAVWSRDNASRSAQDLYLYRRDTRGNWGAGELVERQADSVVRAHADMNDRGTVAVGWQSQDNVTGESALWARVYERMMGH